MIIVGRRGLIGESKNALQGSLMMKLAKEANMKKTVKTAVQNRLSHPRIYAAHDVIANLTQALGEKLRRQHEAWLRRSRTRSVNAAIGTPA